MHKTTTILAVGLIGMVTLCSSCAGPETLPVSDHPATDAYEGWRLGCQAYTFKNFTFYEAVDKVASLGMDWIEAYPGQRLSKETGDLKFNDLLSPEIRQRVKTKLADAGVRLVNYGVVGLPADTVECRKVFDFAKDMGVETIVSEPPEDAFDIIEKLCEEYQIKVAIHNHPKPSPYWNPDTVLEAVKGRSKLIGVCGDTGHWMRSGVNPLEALQKMEGRLISLHFKDLNEFGVLDAHDVVWGSGKADVKALLTELDRQNFQGVFSVEYEHNWDNSVPEIRQCAAYFNQVAGELKPAGWQDLLAPDLSNTTFKPGSWTMEDGVLSRVGGGNIWTKERYGDFILDLEFKLAENTNSGVFIRTGDIDRYVETSIEVQIHETSDGSNHGACGAIFDCLSPSIIMTRETGEWNHYTITGRKNKIYVVMNDEQIIDMDLDLWTEPGKNPDLIVESWGRRDTVCTTNKFETAIKDMPRVGYIGLQDHGQPVWYRNIKIKALED